MDEASLFLVQKVSAYFGGRNERPTCEYTGEGWVLTFKDDNFKDETIGFTKLRDAYTFLLHLNNGTFPKNEFIRIYQQRGVLTRLQQTDLFDYTDSYFHRKLMPDEIKLLGE